MLRSNVIGTFYGTRTTATAGTALTVFIDPLSGGQLGSGRRLFKVDTSKQLTCGANTFQGFPNWWGSDSAFAHVTSLQMIGNVTTSHTLKIMRPLNWTWFTAAVASTGTAITLFDDPGAYATTYKYPLPSGAVPAVADATITSTNKYVAFQLSDGTWQLDVIASGTQGGGNLRLTTGVPAVAGVTIPINSPLFYFGAQTLADPATGVNPGFDISTTGTTTLSQQIVVQDVAGGSLWSTFHRGDPLLIYDGNATTADVIAGVFGVYTKDW